MPKLGFGMVNVDADRLVPFARIDASLGLSATGSPCPVAKTHPLGATLPSNRRASPMIGLARTASGTVSAAAGTSDALEFDVVEEFDGATPGSALNTWRPPQPVKRTAPAAPRNGARFNVVVLRGNGG